MNNSLSTTSCQDSFTLNFNYYVISVRITPQVIYTFSLFPSPIFFLLILTGGYFSIAFLVRVGGGMREREGGRNIDVKHIDWCKEWTHDPSVLGSTLKPLSNTSQATSLGFLKKISFFSKLAPSISTSLSVLSDYSLSLQL